MKVCDMHCDTLCAIRDKGEGLKTNSFMISLDKCAKSNYFLQDFACFVIYPKEPYETCKGLVKIYHEELKKNPEIIPVLTKEDLDKEGFHSMLSIEEGGALNGDMNKFYEFFNDGVRLITLTWNFKNEIASPNDVRNQIPNETEGLTEFGIELVKKMEEVGCAIDVSHLGDKGFYDVIKYTKGPIIASHSNSRSVCNHVRNLKDDMIKLIAERKGLIGINFCHDFITESKEDATVDDIIKHIDYIKNLVGVDVIGLGTDFDGISNKDIEVKDASMMNLLYDGLLKHGYSEEECDKIFYKNAIRVLKSILK